LLPSDLNFKLFVIISEGVVFRNDSGQKTSQRPQKFKLPDLYRENSNQNFLKHFAAGSYEIILAFI
tara:strand:- start:6815 stop:7012 length:198 start_codon:yes stop_codon:yes gene_type:complete